MKKFNYRYILLAVWALTISTVFLSSCDDEEDGANGGKVTLLSFGPAGVHHGETIKFIGENLNKVTSIVLAPNLEIPASGFASQSNDLIELVIPEAAEAGKVILKSSDGDIESKTELSFEVPVTITSVTGQAKPGTNITITGEMLNWIEAIGFPANSVVTKEDFVSQSMTELVVTVPMEAQSGFIGFLTGGTKPLVIYTEEVLLVTLPTIESLDPLAVKHEDNLTITGTDLDLVTSVAFAGNVEAFEFVTQTETQIVVQVPVGALKGKVTLNQASGVSVISNDEVTVVLPVGTNLAPKPATPGVDNITITGTNLDLVQKLTLMAAAGATVGVDAAEFVSQSATQIILALPEEAIAGPVNYTTIHGYSALLGVSVSIPVEGPQPLDYYIFKDGLMNGWSEWGGWDVTKDFASTEEVFNGTKSLKATYSGQWGAIQIGSPSPTVFNGYTTLSFRIFAPAEQDYIFQIENNSDVYLHVPAGWSVVDIPISSISGNGNVPEIRFKNNNPNLPVTLYLDEIGLKF